MEGIVTTLLQQRCFLSATIYCDFWISDLQHRIASNSASGSIELELRTSHSLCGDAYQGLKQGRRAMSYYERALSFRATSAAHSAAALQLKIAECALALVDVASFSGQSDDAVSVGIATDALVALETIPLRSLPMHLLLARARLQEDCGRLSDAAQTLSTALSVQPHCIEAALSLIRIFAQHTPGTVGAAPLVDLQRIISVYSTLSQQTNESSAWTVKFIEAHAAFAKYQHRTTLDLLAELDAAYPRCLPVLALTAQAQFQLSDVDLTRLSLERMRKVDPFCIELMDIYAFSLRARCDESSLANLTRALSAIVVGPAGAVELNIAAALHADACNDREKALEYIRKACVIAPNHSLAHCVHGYLLLGTSGGIYFFTASHAPQFDAALDAFRRAYAIDKRDLNVFQGIVDAHLGAGRFKDALFASKEALQRAPKNPKALTLVGSVLGHSVEGRDKARAAFAKALALDSHCLDAVFASAKLDTTEKKYDAAIQLLTRHVSQHNPEFLHTKIANVYLLMEDAASASQHFQLALSFNSQYAPAISGLDRLEGNIKENDMIEFDGEQYDDEEELEEYDEQEL